MLMKKDMKWLKEDFIAHRGLHTKDFSIPENTLSAFKEAISHGYSIEFDINILKDGTVVVFHDPNLKRCFQIDKDLSDLNYEDIKDLRYPSGDHIPLLTEVLAFVEGKVNLLIELKPHGNVKALSSTFMKIMDTYDGVFAAFSFHPLVVYYLKKHHPYVIRGQIAEYFKDNHKMPKFVKFLMRRLTFNPFTKPDFISYGLADLPNKYLNKQYKKGLVVISYAATTQAELDFVKRHYDNIVFEYFHPKKMKP